MIGRDIQSSHVRHRVRVRVREKVRAIELEKLAYLKELLDIARRVIAIDCKHDCNPTLPDVTNNCICNRVIAIDCNRLANRIAIILAISKPWILVLCH
jgi:hypothetical protein